MQCSLMFASCLRIAAGIVQRGHLAVEEKRVKTTRVRRWLPLFHICGLPVAVTGHLAAAESQRKSLHFCFDWHGWSTAHVKSAPMFSYP